MKKLAAFVAVLLVVLAGTAYAVNSEKHVNAELVPNGSTGVSGRVELTQLPHGGANIHLVARGLTPGTVYSSFYYESADCSEPADLLGTFTAGDDGVGETHGKIDDDLDEVGSVSVRIGPGYGALQACAQVH